MKIVAMYVIVKEETHINVSSRLLKLFHNI